MKFVNTTDETVEFPTLGDPRPLIVLPGEEFEVTGQDAKNLEAAGFERTDKPAKETS